jgi:putative membrane protein
MSTLSMIRARLTPADACGLGGVVALVAALAPPSHALAEALFAAHMVQHLLLVVVAAPLLAMAAPGHLLRYLPRRSRLALGRAMRFLRGLPGLVQSPVGTVSIWLGHVTVLWAWHVPVLYEAALRSAWLHALEHTTLLTTAWLFWARVLPPARCSVPGVGAALYLFMAAAQCTVLGALIAFAETTWYAAAHSTTASAWGLTPIEDQQLAGLLMWLPGGMAYAAAAVAVVAGWLRIAERSALTNPSSPAIGIVLLLVVGAGCGQPPRAEHIVVDGDSRLGAKAIRTYGCGGCHVIPGVPAARGIIGPPLAGLAGRPYLAGRLVNNASNLVTWIRDPRALDPGTIMPRLGVTEADARHIAAYLYRYAGEPYREAGEQRYRDAGQ